MARRWKLNFKGTLLLMPVIGLIGLLHGCDSQKHLAEYRLARQHRLVLSAETSWEVSQPLLYEVYEDNKIVVPATDFYYRNPDKPMPKFQLISGKSVFGIVDAASPKKLLIMHDVSSEKTWPRRGDNETFVESALRCKELLAVINAEAKDGPYEAGER